MSKLKTSVQLFEQMCERGRGITDINYKNYIIRIIPVIGTCGPRDITPPTIVCFAFSVFDPTTSKVYFKKRSEEFNYEVEPFMIMIDDYKHFIDTTMNDIEKRKHYEPRTQRVSTFLNDAYLKLKAGLGIETK